MRLSNRTQVAMDEMLKDRFAVRLSEDVRALTGARGAALEQDTHYQATRAAVDRAFHFGFSTTGAVTIYVDAARVLGAEFWRDPRYKDISQHLVRQPDDEPNQRAVRLQKALQDHLDRVLGPERQNLLAFLKAFNGPDLAPRETLHSKADLQAYLQKAAPAICHEIGAPACAAFAEQAWDLMHHDFPDATAQDLCGLCLLGFGFGIGFHIDPYLVWLTKPLNNDQLSLTRQIAAMESRARAWVRTLTDDKGQG